MSKFNYKKLIIIPAYNESECIEDTLEDIKKKAPDYDYLVVNDCSVDKTEKLLRDGNYHYVTLPVNLGIGGAVQTGYRYAYNNGYDIAVQVDGDGQHDIKFLKAMETALTGQDADMVIGSRYLEKKGFQSSALRRAGITYFSWLIKVLCRKRVTDPTSGFRMVDRSCIELFASDYPRDYPEPESIVYLLRKGKKVCEVPVVMRERQGGVSSIRLKRSIYYMIKVSLAILIERIRRK